MNFVIWITTLEGVLRRATGPLRRNWMLPASKTTGKAGQMLVVPGFRSCRSDVVDRLQGAAPRNAEEPAPGPAHSPPMAYFRGHGTRINKDVL